MEVLKLVVEGNTSMQVATQLGLSPKSIDTYRSRLMTKLDARRPAGAGEIRHPPRPHQRLTAGAAVALWRHQDCPTEKSLQTPLRIPARLTRRRIGRRAPEECAPPVGAMATRLSELPHEQGNGVVGRLERLPRAIAPRVAYAVTALLLALLCFVAARYYATVRSDLTEVVMARRAAVAQLAASTLSERLDRMLDVGVSLATRVRFAELVAAGQWDAAIQVLRSVPQDFRFIERVALFDVRGTAMAAFPESNQRGQNFASREWYQGVSREWKPHVSGVYRRSTPPQRAVFAVAVPILDRAGAPAGILQMQVQLESFFDWAQAMDPGPGSAVYVVDGKGAAAYDSRRPQQTDVADLSAHPAVARLLRGESGVQTTGPIPYMPTCRAGTAGTWWWSSRPSRRSPRATRNSGSSRWRTR